MVTQGRLPMWTIDLPVRVPISGNRKFSLNLNQYRNAHFQILDKAKKSFKALVTPRFQHLPFLTRIHIDYVFYAPSQQLSDLGNVVAIVDKFFCDALVEGGKIEDDNRTIVVSTSSRFGGVDKGNPRVEATVEPISAASRAPRGSIGINDAENPLSAPQPPIQANRQETDLKIQIVQREIEEAVRDFIRKQITVKEGMEISMEFSATRGDDGLIAAIDISPAAPAPTKTVSPRAPRTTASAPAPAVEEAPAHSEVASNASTTEAEANASSQPSAGDASDEPETVPGEAPLKSSIFGNLRRPTNEAEGAAA